MTARTLVVLTFSFSSAIYAQSSGADGTFHFTTPQTEQSIKEAVTILRIVADLPQVSADDSQATVRYHGAAAKVALADWMLPQLDRPVSNSTPQEYKMSGDDFVRVNVLANVTNAQAMQELLTVLRTVADIQKVFNYSQNQVIALRGSAADIAFAEWIIDQLNRPVQQNPDTTPRQFTVNTQLPLLGTAARVNYLANVKTPLAMQELLTTIRVVGEVQKVFNYTEQQALVLRGTDTIIARAEWLIQQLDQPAGAPNAGTHVFTAPTGDDVTRVFFLTNATRPGLITASQAVRNELKINRVFITTTPASVVVRGTTDQVAAAAQVIAANGGLALLQ